VPDIKQFRPEVPPPLDSLLRRMLIKGRETRISSTRQVGAELEAIRAGRPLEAVESGWAPTGEIETPGRSRLKVTDTPPPLPVPDLGPHSGQQIRFAISSDGVRIAYATAGEGPVFVKAANWLSHLEYDWNSPVWRHWLQELSRHHTLVRYDERGCGLSDWQVDDLSVEALVEDLEAVVDALGLDRFPLLGVSQGGPIAIAYAVRHPQKVSHLILYGTYARGRFNRDYSRQETELGQMILRLMNLGWGQDNPASRQFFSSLFMPEATAQHMHWFNDLQRVSTSPEMAVRLETAFFHIDVSDLARQVDVPTLILHAPDDGGVPFEEGRQLATLIPDALFVPLESKNHILFETEPAWRRFVAEIHGFVGLQATE
jgi:pimeloyl-ACP methyl ester carboxylesterase